MDSAKNNISSNALDTSDINRSDSFNKIRQRAESKSKLTSTENHCPTSDQQEMISLDKIGSPQIKSTDDDISIVSAPGIELNAVTKRPYPKKVFFIIANEFCERFSFYGLRTILVLYLRNVLNFSDSNSTVVFHLFATMCHLTPILGAILADSVWGKFRTILNLSIVYVFGELILVISSIVWNHGTASVDLTLFGLLMISIGTGGIKPCVGALGGDQYLPHEQKRRDLFFPMFYGSIHLASLISVFLSPIFRSDFQCAGRSDCYPFAFSIPCGLMLIAIIVFYSAKKSYLIVPLPNENVILAFCKCIWLALKRKIFGPPKPDFYEIKSTWSARTKSISSSCSSLNNSNYVLKNTQIIDGGSFRLNNSNQKNNTNHWLYLASDKFDSKLIEDFRIILGILLLLLPIPVFYTLHDQQGSLWTLQANRMDGRVFNTGFVFDPDQILVANPLLILANIPIFQFLIYPCLNKLGFSTKPIPRMTMGGMLAASAFVLSGLIEYRIQHFLPATKPPVGEANLIFVNGFFEDCGSISSTTIAYSYSNGSTTTQLMNDELTYFGPQRIQSINLNSTTNSELEKYQFNYKINLSLNSSASNISKSCSDDGSKIKNFNVNSLPESSIQLMYLMQENGNPTYKIFNESLELPPAGRARVKLLYQGLSSQIVQEEEEENGFFYLISKSSSTSGHHHKYSSSGLKFKTEFIDGQVTLSKHLDVNVPAKGAKFVLIKNDDELNFGANNNGNYNYINTKNNSHILLKPGTRNLIVVRQVDAMSLEYYHEYLQDNDYRISMLYQLAPHLLIAMADVTFSITGLEFSYAMAPESMKSVILGAWHLTTAIGNAYTVAIESLYTFTSNVDKFFFYAAFLIIDMIIFALMGYKFKPHQRGSE